MTERQKSFEETARFVESTGGSINGIIIKDIPIPIEMYMDALKLMSDDNLVSHYKDRIEENGFEQVAIIKKELDRRNIVINII